MTNTANKIAENPPRSELIATEGQTAFDYDFWIADEGDIKVAINGGDPLVLHTDYAVDPAGIQNNNGGTITLVAGRTANDVVVAYRETSLARPNSYSEGGAGYFGGAGLNVAFNILYAIIQELFNNLQRTLRLSSSSTYSGDLTLPAPSAGKALQWNGTGDGIENSANNVDSVVTTAQGFATAASDSADTASGAAVIALDARDDASAHADDASDSALAAAASAASINLPSAIGNGLRYLRQKVAEDGLEYLTASQLFSAVKQVATPTETGVVELATDAEAIAGIDNSRAVTPAGLAATLAGAGAPDYWMAGLPLEYVNAVSIRLPAGFVAKDSTNVVLIETTTALTVSLSGGVGVGGLDTGTEANDTWYYPYLIAKDNGADPALIFSTVNEAAAGDINLPATYTLKRQLPLAVRNDGSGNIIPFYCPLLGEVQYTTQCTHDNGSRQDAPTQVLAGGTSTSPTTVSCGSFIPPISRYGNFNYFATGSQAVMLGEAGSGVVNLNLRCDASGIGQDRGWLKTNASQQVEYDNRVGGTGSYLDVMGYQITELVY